MCCVWCRSCRGSQSDSDCPSRQAEDAAAGAGGQDDDAAGGHQAHVSRRWGIAHATELQLSGPLPVWQCRTGCCFSTSL